MIIGENRSFDHVFATYVPQARRDGPQPAERGHRQLDGNMNAIPGPNFDKAQQLAASDLGSQDSFLLSPPKQRIPRTTSCRRRWSAARARRAISRPMPADTLPDRPQHCDAIALAAA